MKGILHPDDARQALEHGVDGIIVSNHGGRQVDGAIAALDALPAVAAAIENKIPILFDSGIRYGADAVKALALGARAVLLARLYIWGLAIAGEQGVRDVVQNFPGRSGPDDGPGRIPIGERTGRVDPDGVSGKKRG